MVGGDPLRRARNARWVLIAVGVVAVVWAFGKEVGLSGGVAAVLAAVTGFFPLVRFIFDDLRKPADDQAERARVLAEHLRFPPRATRESTPNRLGVGESRPTRFREDPYISRDVDETLDMLLSSNPFVLVIGDSAAGKTRTAYESVRRVFPSRRLVVPSKRESLPAIANLDPPMDFDNAVIWLDDIDRYVGLEGLNRHVLERLGRRSLEMTLVGTIRTAEHARLISDRNVDESVRVLLRRAATCRLPTRLSTDEMTRTKIAFQGHPENVLTGIEQYGLGPYLIAGPELTSRYELGRESCPVGFAIVRSAVDWYRTGMTRCVSRVALEQLHCVYLDGDQEPSPEGYTKGLEWARTELYTNIGLLAPKRDGETFGYTVLDYVIDYVAADEPQIPNAIWHTVLAHADAEEAVVVGFTALNMGGNTDIAEQAFVRAHEDGVVAGTVGLGFVADLDEDDATRDRFWRLAAEQGDSAAAVFVGWSQLAAGDSDMAKRWFQRAADGGEAQGLEGLAIIMIANDDLDQASDLLRRAYEADGPNAAIRLGEIEYERGRSDNAAEWFHKAIAVGHPQAHSRLGDVLMEQGEEQEAERHYRAGVAVGEASSQVGLGRMLMNRKGRATEIESKRLFEAAAEDGDPDGQHYLGHILAQEGKHTEAMVWWERAASAGDTASAGHLGEMLLARNSPAKAERWLRQAVRGGYEGAAVDLERVLHGSGRIKESERVLKRAAEAGDALAACRLGWLLVERGARSGERFLRESFDSGHVHAGLRLAMTLSKRGEEEAAQELYRDMAAREYEDDDEALGDVASVLVGVALEEQGKNQEALRWYRAMAPDRRPGVARSLGLLILKTSFTWPWVRSKPEREAEQWLLRASEDGDEVAMRALGDLYAKRGRIDRAEKWWAMSARRGSPVGAFVLGQHFVDLGRTKEGEQWLKKAISEDKPDAWAVRALVNLLEKQGRFREIERLRGEWAAKK